MTPEQGAMLRADAPETIYLQTGDEEDCNADHPLEFDSDQVTWCQDQQYDSDIKYVRADLFTAALSRAEADEARAGRLEEALKPILSAIDMMGDGPDDSDVAWAEGKFADGLRLAKAALADSPNWLRDRLREEREPLVAALKKIRTSWAGYAITKSEQYPEVLSEMWQEVKRMDEIASSAIRALPESE